MSRFGRIDAAVNNAGILRDRIWHKMSFEEWWIFLFSKPRPIRSMHRSEGWTAASIASDLIPAFRNDLAGTERSPDLFCWEPI